MLNHQYHADNHLFSRFLNHAHFGITRDLGDERAQPNAIEKAGNGILKITGMLPKSIKAIGKAFKDPRVVTVALTVIALLTTSFAFYPTTTYLASKAICTFAATLIKQIPFWAVRMSAYLMTCTAIVGFGLRAEGRFTNAPLMKQFYGLPETFPRNPAYMSNSELKAAIRSA
jgi:hypothetical protein